MITHDLSRPLSLVLLIVGAALTGLACGGGDITTPDTGSIAVTTVTTGPEPDADGYAVAIDDGAETPIPANGTIERDNVEPGGHSIRLTGMAPNCTVAGNNPRSVSLPAGETVTVTFELTCSATTGNLQITSTTSGPSPDVDGYTMTVDGTDRGTLAASGAATLDGLTPGSRAIGLSGVAGNCQVEGDNPRSITIVAGASATLTFEVVCAAPPPNAGSLGITTSTSGPDADPDGYTFTIDDRASQVIGLNATETLTNVAAGAHEVLLSGVATNCQLEGDNPRPVTVTAGATSTIVFSIACPTPHTSRIAWVRTDEDDAPGPDDPYPIWDIYVMNADGTTQTNLTDTPADAQERHWAPMWSPNGRKLAFMSIRSNEWPEIYVMTADGGGETRVTSNQVWDQLWGWSPDETRLLSVREDKIFAVRVDGSGETKLTDNASEPSWSPDGSKILFWRDFDFYVMNADGTGQTNITNHHRQSGDGTWSPDGSQIAFTGIPDGTSNLQIFVMNADGSGLRQLTNDGGNEPIWSPDGSRIAYQHGPTQIYAINADGSGQTNLTNDPDEAVWPTWSPDGSKLAFVSLRDGNREIYVMNADGSDQRRLTNDPRVDMIPVWSP